MERFSKEARKKRKETIENNLQQMSLLEERETHINVDYFEGKIKIYTNNITVINRMSRLGYSHAKEEYIDANVYSRYYEFPIELISKFVTGAIFK